MTALTGMRVVAFTRTGRIIAPVIAVLVIVGTLNGGGQSQVGDAYGLSAAFLFPVLAWQTKLLLDGEPDVQRRLARVAVGSELREQGAGLAAAALAALPLLAIALTLPWALNGVTGPENLDDQPLATGLTLGFWAHVILVPAGVALGALASRAVTGTTGRGAAVLVAGSVLALVLGLQSSPVPWIAPPVLEAARIATSGSGVGDILIASVWALVWAGLAIFGYSRLRRRRA